LRLTYRFRQFFFALAAKPSKEEIEIVNQTLSPELQKIFYQLKSSDQKHSIEIFKKLKAQGEKDPDLFLAALLHDVGKCLFPLRLWERVMIVLGQALFPNVVSEWGQGNVDGWERPFVIACQHAQWGADLAKSAGASPLTVYLIRRHQDGINKLRNENEDREERSYYEEDLLYRLQKTDNES
jgi:hypothetical protein